MIALIDDDAAVRRSTALLLESGGYRVRSFPSGDAFLAAGPPERFDCAILDSRMPGRSGLDVLRALDRRGGAPAVLMLTGHADIGLAVEAMKLNAADVIEKPYKPEALLEALESASASARRSRAAQAADREASALVESLTGRQRQVLAGIVAGRPNKVIAWQLGLSVRTIEAYRAQTLDRLGVRSTAEAVRIAVAAGIDEGD